MTVHNPSQQLPLALKLPVKTRLEDYIAEDPQPLLASLLSLLDDASCQLVYLYGPTDAGKTHLLGALCQQADAAGKSVMYLSLKEYPAFTPEILESLEQAELVCLDDIDRIAGISEWETALFHLFNRLRDSGRKLLVSAAQPPTLLDIRLPDLKSRLAWGVSHVLKPLTDEEKKTLLQQRADQLGMSLPDDSVNYLLNHHSRHTGDLLQALDRLERASMAAKRKLTVPFVREVLTADN